MPGGLISAPAVQQRPFERDLAGASRIAAAVRARQPANVFVLSEQHAMVIKAKGRSTGAFFRAGDGSNFLFVTGSSKAAVDSVDTVPPCIVKLRVVTTPGQPAYLAVEASQNTLGFLSPGSPWVTSSGADNAIVWVLVANVPRGCFAVRPQTCSPDPLRARSGNAAAAVGEHSTANIGGKYNTPAFGLGRVFVGTDRIQAFGLSERPPRRRR